MASPAGSARHADLRPSPCNLARSATFVAKRFVHDATPARKMLARIRRGIAGYEGPRRRERTMKSPICDMLGIEFPLLAFSHCRDVVAAVSRAGGFGVLGATVHTPDTLERELKWIDDHVDGKPYGIDVLIPENISTAGEKDRKSVV